MVGQFNDPRLNAILDLGTSLFHQTVESTLEAMVAGMVQEQVPGLLEQAVQLMETQLQGFEFPLDLGLGNPLNLRFDYHIGRVAPQPGEGLLLQLDFDVRASSQAPILARCPQSPLSRVLGSAPPAPGDVSASVALRLDAINAVLHRLWAAGVLNLDVSNMVPEQLRMVTSRVAVDALLPPLVAPIEPGQGIDGLLEIQAGEVLLYLDHAAGTDVMSLSLREAVQLTLTNDQISLALEAEPRVDIRSVESAVPGQPALPPEALEDLTRSFVWPMVIEQIGPGLSYPIPSLPLTQVATIAPDLADLTFHLDVTGHGLQTRNHHVLAEGGFSAEAHPAGGGGGGQPDEPPQQ